MAGLRLCLLFLASITCCSGVRGRGEGSQSKRGCGYQSCFPILKVPLGHTMVDDVVDEHDLISDYSVPSALQSWRIDQHSPELVAYDGPPPNIEIGDTSTSDSNLPRVDYQWVVSLGWSDDDGMHQCLGAYLGNDMVENRGIVVTLPPCARVIHSILGTRYAMVMNERKVQVLDIKDNIALGWVFIEPVSWQGISTKVTAQESTGHGTDKEIYEVPLGEFVFVAEWNNKRRHVVERTGRIVNCDPQAASSSNSATLLDGPEFCVAVPDIGSEEGDMRRLGAPCYAKLHSAYILLGIYKELDTENNYYVFVNVQYYKTKKSKAASKKTGGSKSKKSTRGN